MEEIKEKQEERQKEDEQQEKLQEKRKTEKAEEPTGTNNQQDMNQQLEDADTLLSESAAVTLVLVPCILHWKTGQRRITCSRWKQNSSAM